MEFENVCYVTASSEKHGTRGILSLLRISDTNYIMEYKDSRRSVCTDIDLVTIDRKNKIVQFQDVKGTEDSINFIVVDDMECQLLCEAKQECETVCDLSLRLNSALRDVYFSALYGNLGSDPKFIIQDEIEKLKKTQPQIFFNSIIAPSADAISGDDNKLNKSSTSGMNASCVFCDVSKLLTPDRDFFIHPYVPKTFQDVVVHMCSICIENWKEYREVAEHEKLLVLEGETNEEICAVCSDTPDTLVLCSGCPRSFCDACLSKILSPQELREITAVDNESDWICMCCLGGEARLPPLGRDSWKYAGGRGANNSNNGEKGGARGSAVNNKVSSVTAETKLKLKESENISRAVATSSAPPPPLPLSVTSNSSTSNTSNTSSNTSNNNKHKHDTNADNSTNLSDFMTTNKKQRRESNAENSTTATPSKPPLSTTKRQRAARESNANENPENTSNTEHSAQADTPDTTQNTAQAHLPLPPVHKELDEVYYFGQYVDYCHEISETVSTGGKRAVSSAMQTTDDVCFLCKDGGELIECDWRVEDKRSKCRCLKVYHEYCLDYEVKEGIKWLCPRHYCDVCGVKELKYMCKFCPMALCDKCPNEVGKKSGQSATYSLQDDIFASTPTSAANQTDIITIACHACCLMINKGQKQGKIQSGEVVLEMVRFGGAGGVADEVKVKKGGRASV